MKIFWFALLTVSLFLTVSAGAQGPGGDRRSRPQGSRPQGFRPQGGSQAGRTTRGGLNSSFERSAPKVGELLPDIKALDADGKPLELRSLKGHYSVLVFGCLT